MTKKNIPGFWVNNSILLSGKVNFTKIPMCIFFKMMKVDFETYKFFLNHYVEVCLEDFFLYDLLIILVVIIK